MIATPLAALPPFIGNYLPFWIAGVIIVVGLFVYGLKDTLALTVGAGFKRAWAISSVCFAESIRKRVLWITPLAIIGVIIVSQFQRPIDEADAVRQMLKVCLFATGMVVTITAIILACTNLPKEIENRVVYTVVTKPVTRLEIVVGKVLGFARVSLAILLIMGIFTTAYLMFNAWQFQRGIASRLQSPTMDATARPTLEYYRDTGLLTARKLATPISMQVVARDPSNSGEHWILGGEGDVFVPFDLQPSDLVAPGDQSSTPLAAGVLVQLNIGYDGRLVRAEDEPASDLPPTIAAPATQEGKKAAVEARIGISLLDGREEQLVPTQVLDGGKPLVLPDPTGAQPIAVYADPKALPNVERWNRVYVVLAGNTSAMEYRLNNDSVKLLIPPADPNGEPRVIKPSADISQWQFRGRLGRVGYQIRGGKTDEDPTHVAVFSLTNAAATAESSTGKVPIEFRSDVERSGTDDSNEQPTQMQMRVRNRADGKISEPVTVLVEANRPTYCRLPAELLVGGEYDVLVRCLTPGHYLSVTPFSVAVVQENQGFVFNLGKSMLIMWLMAILVIAVAVFSSTFLSWPIAIVLTLVMLLCRWGVLQLGDALQPGIGNQVATDLGFRDPAPSAVVSKSVEALARFLNTTAGVLPDISQFASIEDLERGVAVPSWKLNNSVLVLVTFGVPIVVLAYVILRNKEVAP